MHRAWMFTAVAVVLLALGVGLTVALLSLQPPTLTAVASYQIDAVGSFDRTSPNAQAHGRLAYIEHPSREACVVDLVKGTAWRTGVRIDASLASRARSIELSNDGRLLAAIAGKQLSVHEFMPAGEVALRGQTPLDPRYSHPRALVWSMDDARVYAQHSGDLPPGVRSEIVVLARTAAGTYERSATVQLPDSDPIAVTPVGLVHLDPMPARTAPVQPLESGDSLGADLIADIVERDTITLWDAAGNMYHRDGASVVRGDNRRSLGRAGREALFWSACSADGYLAIHAGQLLVVYQVEGLTEIGRVRTTGNSHAVFTRSPDGQLRLLVHENGGDTAEYALPRAE